MGGDLVVAHRGADELARVVEKQAIHPATKGDVATSLLHSLSEYTNYLLASAQRDVFAGNVLFAGAVHLRVEFDAEIA